MDSAPCPTPQTLEKVREKIATIDAELLSCHQRVEDLELLASLDSAAKERM